MKSLLILLTVLTTQSSNAQQYRWQVIAAPGSPVFVLDFKDSLHGWCGARDAIYRTIDGGHSWQPAIGVATAAHSISMIDTLVGWAAEDFEQGGGPFDSYIQRTTNGGSSWFTQLQNNDRTYGGIYFQTTQKATAAGYTHRIGFVDTAKIVQTSDGGLTWTTRTVGDSIWYLDKIQFVDSLHGWVTYKALPYIFNSHPGVLRTEDGGASWEAVPLPKPEEALEGLTSISFVDSLHGWGSSYNSSSVFRVLSTSDGGRS